jgi:hypothetical protein
MERQAKDGTVYQKVGDEEWAPVTRTAKDGTVYKKVGPETWAPAEDSSVSQVQSAARGFAQGASLGFADEVTGGAEALWDKAKGNTTEFAKLYKQHRDESRQNYKKAQEANPVSYGSGELGGGIATAVLPFGSTATVAKAALTGAKLGAIAGLGASEADNVGGMAKDTLIGGATGAAGGAIGKSLEKGVSTGAKALSALGKGAASKAASAAEAVETANPSVVKEATVSAKNRLKSFFHPEVDPSFEEFSKIAKKNGIDPSELPESVKFGPDSSASRASRSLAEGRFGEETLKRFNNTLQKARDAFDGKIANYTKGVPSDEVTAGKLLRDSYDEGVSKFFDQMDFTHNTIVDQVPGLQITGDAVKKIESKLSGIEKFAKGRIQRGVTNTQREQAKQLLSAVEAIRSGNGSYKQTVEALRDIGEAAFQSKNSLADIPVDVSKMRDLYGTINDALTDSVRANLGDDIAKKLSANNKAMSDFFGQNSLVSRVMGDKSIAPEQAFKSLVLSGDSQRLEALKKIVPPERWEYLKGAVLDNLVKRSPEGDFSFKQLHNTMRGKKTALSTIFTPEELADHVDLVRLGDRFGQPVLSTSGTGASLSFQDITKAPVDLTVNALALRNANKAAQRALDEKAGVVSGGPLDKARQFITSDNSKEAIHKAASIAPALHASKVLKSTEKDTPSDSAPPTKGASKWANDGLKKLIDHSGSDGALGKIDTSAIKDQKLKDMLIAASDLKPGSKAMEKVLVQVKARLVKN